MDGDEIIKKKISTVGGRGFGYLSINRFHNKSFE